MSVTLAVAIISLLPAAVGFYSHKDNVQWHFVEKKREETVETSSMVSDSVVKQQWAVRLALWVLYMSFFPSLIEVQNIQGGRQVGWHVLSWGSVKKRGEKNEQREQGIRNCEQMIEIS